MFLVARMIMSLKTNYLTFITFSCQWLQKTNRKPLFAAVEKMKEGTLCWKNLEKSLWNLESSHSIPQSIVFRVITVFNVWHTELMLLGFISLLLTATSSIISSTCIPSKFYNNVFAPCTKSEVDEEMENKDLKERKLLMAFTLQRRVLNTFNRNTCGEVNLIFHVAY